MQTKNITKVFKTMLIFGLLSISIDIVKRLIYTKMDFSRIFETRFLTEAILFEFIALIITGFITYFLTKKLQSKDLGTSLIKVLIFSLIYSILSLFVFLIIGAGRDFQFDIYSFFLKFIPNGIMQGVLFMFVLNHKSYSK